MYFYLNFRILKLICTSFKKSGIAVPARRDSSSKASSPMTEPASSKQKKKKCPDLLSHMVVVDSESLTVRVKLIAAEKLQTISDFNELVGKIDFESVKNSLNAVKELDLHVQHLLLNHDSKLLNVILYNCAANFISIQFNDYAGSPRQMGKLLYHNVVFY
ncbi:hypothetical protein ACHWQZ_G011277 [Mnemiopsis leidyi]